jgi:hypothetical protein
MKNVFERIYEGNVWGNAESCSGDGSDGKGTEAIRTAIGGLLSEYDIKSVVDVPCGDFNWMNLVDLSGVAYLGGDVVSEMIARNRTTYRKPGVDFRVLDATRDSIPNSDLLFCRDLLVHLSFADIRAVLRNFSRSDCRFLLTTTFPARDPNKDVETGQWRPLNLQRPPFSFPRPIRLVAEYCNEWNGFWRDKCLGLWRLDSLAGLIGGTERRAGRDGGDFR